MSEQNKHIDDLFREMMEQHQEMPPAGVWDAIETRLDLDKAPLPKPVSYRWLWYVAAAALIAVLGYFVAKSFSENKPGKKRDEPISQITEEQRPQNKDIAKTGETTEEVIERTMNESSAERTTEPEENNPENATTSKTATSDDKNENDKAANNKTAGGTKKKLNNNAATENNKTADPAAGKESKGNKANVKSKNKQSKNQEAETHDANKAAKEVNTASENKEETKPAETTAAKPSKEEKPVASKKKNVKTKPPKTKKTAKPVDAETAAAKPPKPAEPAKENKKAAKPVNAETTAAKPPKPVKLATASKKDIKTEPAKENKKAAKPVDAETAAAKPPKPVKPVTVEKKDVATEPAKENKKTAKTVDAETPAKKPLKEDKGAVKLGKNSKIKVIDEENNATQSPESNKKEEDKTGGLANAAKNQGKVADNTEALKKEDKPVTTEEDKNETVVNPFDEEKQEDKKDEATGGSTGSDTDAPSAPLRNFGTNRMIAAGVKLGFDRGFGKVTTNNFVLSPFIQWNISPKVSLVIQPGIRYSSLSSATLSDQSFHKIISQQLDSAHIEDSGSSQQDSITRIYIYHDTYDSLRVTTTLNGLNAFEFDLPLMIQYKVSPKLSIFGGINLTFGKMAQIKYDEGQPFTKFRVDTLSFPKVPDSTLAPNIPGHKTYFSYNTPDYSTFNNAPMQNPTTNPVRFGYVLGLSYELRQQFLIDLMVRQNLSDMSYIPNEEVRKIYKQPYVRISVGYKFINPEKKKGERRRIIVWY